jgi:hypothetical protein
MATATASDAKFGSSAWFLGWGEALANAGLTAITNTIAGKTLENKSAQTGSGTATTDSKILGWIPYVLLAGAALVLILVIGRRK